MLISGLHPRVSGSVDAESGLGANISSTFSVWALRLLKTAIHSVEGQEKDKAGDSVFLVFPGGSDSKESVCNAGDLGSIPGLGRRRAQLKEGMPKHSSILPWRIP